MKHIFQRFLSSPFSSLDSRTAIRTSRRKFLCGCGCGALAITSAGAGLLAAASRAEAATGGPLIRVGHMPAGCVSHLLLAKLRGEFAAAGLRVELSQFNGPSEALQALLADRLELMQAPWTMTAAAYAKGTTELRIVGGSGKGGIELVARKDSVGSVDEFIAAAGKGLRVGTLRLDTLELVGYGTMALHGKSYEDYDMTFFPSMAGMGEAIANGRLDVCTLAQPYAENVVSANGARYLSDSNAVWGPEAADCVITTKQGTSEQQADALKLYLKVLRNSAASLQADYSAALEQLQPVYGVERPVLEVALARQVPNPVITPTGVDGLKRGAEYLKQLGYFSDNPIDRIIDLRHQPQSSES